MGSMFVTTGIYNIKTKSVVVLTIVYIKKNKTDNYDVHVILNWYI